MLDYEISLNHCIKKDKIDIGEVDGYFKFDGLFITLDISWLVLLVLEGRQT